MGDARLWRIAAALFLAGFATFSLLYCTQPLLAELARDFRVDAATSAWAVSATTATLAVSIFGMGAVSQRLDPRMLMFGSMVLAALCNLGAAAAPEWGLLLTARALEGLALGGVPGTAMAYLAAEAPPERLGLAMGLNVAGAAFGGMTGRVAMGALAELTSWRVAIAALSLGDLIAATVFIALLPRARSEPPREAAPLAGHLGAWLGHLRDRTLLRLYLTAFLAMGAFVAAYNYIGFRLLAPPYRLNQGQVGLIFLSYLLGMAASSWGGALADRFGRRPMILAGAVAAIAGEALTLASPLFWVIVGVAVLTAGFFVVHSVASGWVGARALANRSHASSLYLLAYYAGASLLGWSGGWLWRSRGWPGLVAGCAAAMLAVLGLAASIGASEPAPTPRRDHGSAA